MPSMLKILRTYHPTLKKIVDADQDVLLHVTKKDCKEGDMLDPSNCSMALSAKRGVWDNAIISRSTAYLIKDDIAYRHIIPHKGRQAINNKDQTNLFEEGDYALLSPRPAGRLGIVRSVRSKYPRKNKNRKKNRAVLRTL